MSCAINKTLPDGMQGSTYLNSQIDSYGSLVYYVKTLLGYPHVNVELDDGQFKVIIDDAIEKYTQWVRGEEKMLIFAPDNYDPNCGVKLDELINPCNTCIQSCSTTVVTGTECTNVFLTEASALLSASESYFVDREYFDLTKNDSPAITSREWFQHLTLNYNPSKPWNTANICNFDSIVIRPKNSNWYELSGNSSIWPDLSGLPISALSAYPISSIPLSAFYGGLTATTWPLEASMNVSGGIGNVFPQGDLSKYDICPAPNYFWRIDPNLSIVLLDCNRIPYVGLDGCHDLSNNLLTANFLSGTDGTIIDNPWVVNVDINNDKLDDVKLTDVCYISASDGSVFPPSHLNIKPNTYVELINFPYCANNNQLPLNWNNGIYANFSLCNTSLNTFGDISVPTVKFLTGCQPDESIFFQQLTGWENGGFRLKKTLSALESCTLKTPCFPEVDVDFYRTSCSESTGTEVAYLSTYYDYDLLNYRKVQGCFSADFANNGYGGGFGGDNYLFSLDLAVAQNLFGDRLMGNGDSRNRFDLTSYHLAKGYVEHIRKMFRNVTWTFNQKTQYLKIYPEPKYGSQYCYLLGVYLEPSIREILNEEFIKNYTYGQALKIIGKIRGRYGAISLVGGATIDGASATEEGEKIVTEALADLRDRQRYDIGQSIYTF